MLPYDIESLEIRKEARKGRSRPEENTSPRFRDQDNKPMYPAQYLADVTDY